MSAGGKGLSDFLAEAGEIVESLSRELLALDERRGHEADPDRLNAIFRSAHSLKGVAGLFGQDRIAHLAHRAEDLLDHLRLGKVELTDAVLDALVEAVDVFQALLAEAGRDQASDVTSLRAGRLSQQLGALGGAASTAEEGDDPLERLALDPQTRRVFTEYEEHRLRENAKKGVPLWTVRAAFDLSDFDHGLADLNARLKTVGEVISTLPSAQPGDPNTIAFDLVFGSGAGEAGIRAAIDGVPAALEPIATHEPEGSVTPPPASPEPPLAPPRVLPSARAPRSSEAPPAAEASIRSLTQTVRVDIGRLDALMNTVGELLLVKANVQRLAESARQGGVHAISKLWGQELFREGRQLERKLDDLQKGLLDARMVPLGQVFDKLARLVRRIAREAGKEIELVVTGGDVELDKLIVEELSDPLMHIIRNSIDHGIERPEQRVAKGKPRRGVIALRARQQGNHVIVQVADDGAGIDEARVRDVALERGLISAAQVAELDRREVQNLIFLPGFSTARSVSELSGRGVGLDVVKTNIARLSGIIDLQSEPGQGSTFRLTLPVTLAIIRALVVGVSGRVYAVPLNSVLEIVSVTPAEIRTVDRREVISLRGQTLPFMRLSRLFRHPERAELTRHFVVVVGLAEERLGIAVDELLGQQDIVTKPLGGRLQHVRGVSGATDLGDRRAVLVLDVGELLEESLAPAAARAGGRGS